MNEKRHFIDFLSPFIHNEIMRKGLNPNKLKSLGIFTSEDAKKIGFSQPTLSRLRKKGILKICRRSYYCHIDSKINPDHIDFIIASKKFGTDAAIGLWSALGYHQLTENIPQQVWVVVPRAVKTKDTFFRCVRVETNPNIGVINFRHFKITNIERTIIESLRFASKVGLTTGLRAAKIAFKDKMTTPQKLMKVAKELGLQKYLIKHWESISIE